MELQTVTDKGFGDIPVGYGVFAVMGLLGDTKTIWDVSKPDEVEAARQLFDTLVKKKGYQAFRVKGNGDPVGHAVREFDPNEGRYIFVPQLQGG